MVKGRVFEVYDLNGDVIECEAIMTYHSLYNNCDYVFYTDNNYNKDNNLNLYASRYLGEDDDKMILEEIEDEREWQLLDKALESAKEGLKEDGR